jgi:hypothetical protein
MKNEGMRGMDEERRDDERRDEGRRDEGRRDDERRDEERRDEERREECVRTWREDTVEVGEKEDALNFLMGMLLVCSSDLVDMCKYNNNAVHVHEDTKFAILSVAV